MNTTATPLLESRVASADQQTAPAVPVAHGKSVAPNRLEFIDSLRGLAFLVVLIFHAGQHGFGTHSLLKLTGLGEFGVQLFYVISAATLFLSLTSRWTKDKYPYVAFFIRRFFRIAPMFWLAILFYVWWDGMGPRVWAPNGISGKDIAATFAFAHGWLPSQINAVVPGGWPVGVEMCFYLIVPFLFMYVRTLQKAVWFFLGAMILGEGLSHFADRIIGRHWPAETLYMVNKFTYFWLPAQLPVFALGIILFFLLKKNSAKNSPVQDPAVRSSNGLLILGCAVMLAAICASWKNPILKQHVGYGMVFLLVAWGLSLRPTMLVVNRFTRYLGMVSFSGYLAQFFALDVCDKLVLHVFGKTPLHDGSVQFIALSASALGLTLVIASACYYLVEQPGQQLGKTLIGKIERSFSTPQPVVLMAGNETV